MLEITRDLIKVLNISFNMERNLEFQTVPIFTLPQISIYTLIVILFLIIL